jgi:cyclopropane fatty-acyl-phospholipid synthase-like methyltransferase
MVWIHAINESAASAFVEAVLNPMHPDKFRTLGSRVRLQPGQRVLDVGAGRCGPALVLAREFDCRVTAVEPYEPFLEEARDRVAAAGLSERFEFAQSAGADFVIEAERYDVAMCIGAEWAFGGVEGTIRALAPGVKPGGHVVLGTVYFIEGQNSLDGAARQTLEEVIGHFEAHGLGVVSLIRSSDDDFDTYSSIKATSLLDWLEANPDHADVEEVRGWRRDAVAELTAKHFGWAVIAGRKRVTASS